MKEIAVLTIQGTEQHGQLYMDSQTWGKYGRLYLQVESGFLGAIVEQVEYKYQIVQFYLIMILRRYQIHRLCLIYLSNPNP